MTSARNRPPAVKRQFIDWVREHAIFIDPAAPPDPERLEPLDALLTGRQVAALCTTTPYCAQYLQFRRWLLAYLVTRDFTLIGTCESWAQARRTDRLLHDPTGTGRLPTRDDVDLAHVLRGHALQGMSLNVFGFDIGGVDPQGWGELAALVAEAGAAHDVATDAVRANLLQLLQQPPAPSPADESARCGWALEWVDLQFAALTDRLGGEVYRQLVHGLTALHDSLGYLTLVASSETRAEAQALRHDVAQTNLASALADLYPGRRAAVLTECVAEVADSTTPRPLSLHAFIRHTLAAEATFSVWLLHGGGRRGPTPSRGERARGAARGARLTVPADSLNALLAGVGGTFLLPLNHADDPRARAVLDDAGIVQADNSVVRCAVAREMDAIYFAPEITAPIRG